MLSILMAAAGRAARAAAPKIGACLFAVGFPLLLFGAFDAYFLHSRIGFYLGVGELALNPYSDA